jgi:glucose/arabinose dehydrogenase
LYITLGQPQNGQPRDKLYIYNDRAIAGAAHIDPFDRSKCEVYVTGIRNLVRPVFNSKNNDLWSADSHTDVLVT